MAGCTRLELATSDVSALRFPLYYETFDTLLFYPTYVQETGECVVGVLGMGPMGEPGDAMFARVTLGGGTFAEVAKATRSVHERELGLARMREVAGLRQLERYGLFDPYLDEPVLARFAIKVLSAMVKIGFWEQYQVADIPHRRYRRVASPDERKSCLGGARAYRISLYEWE